LLIKEGFDQNLGAGIEARNPKAYSDPLAIKIVTGEVVEGGRVLMDAENGKITFETPKLLPPTPERKKLAKAKK
jgi:hypothetical protein